jgi:hypothetical protein
MVLRGTWRAYRLPWFPRPETALEGSLTGVASTLVSRAR